MKEKCYNKRYMGQETFLGLFCYILPLHGQNPLHPTFIVEWWIQLW